MAKDNNSKSSSKVINNLVVNIRNNMDNLYKNTYFSQANNKKDLKNIKMDIDNSIDSIINANVDNVGVPNISQLYTRMHMKDGNKGEGGLNNELENLFNDKSLTDSLMLNFTENRHIKDFDDEIDIICKYMPTLEDALDAKKDNVLSADQFSKDFINVINKSNVDKGATFNERIKELKKKYNLIELFEDAYDNASRYGEQFIYNVDYSKALTRLLATKNNTMAPYVTNEAASEVVNGVITESFDLGKMCKDVYGDMLKEDEMLFNYGEMFTVELNTTGVLESFILEKQKATNVFNENANKFETTIKDDIAFEGLEKKKNKETIDGLIDINATTKNSKVSVPGRVIKRLKRENVIPIYIEDLCLGYYYIENDANELFTGNSMNDPMLSLKSGSMRAKDEINRDTMIQHMSSKLSSMIDAKFINVNQDLTREIYMILKHNDIFNGKQANQFRVTFIPPEDMEHIYFKKDPKTNRGVSDLEKALLPAKLYTSLYVNGYLGVMTRGHDKRVYYVKQNIDTNISKVLLNTINQIKKGNMGTRELTSVKNLLNVTGRYNDYIIPVGASGDAPINFEVMQGQDIDIKQELLDIFEQMAVNSTDVPYEYIQSRQTVDYAVRLTMSNGKFLRKVFKRQARCELYFSSIITKIYNSEYGENDTLEVELPPPAFLNLLNTNTMIQNINDTVQHIVEMEMNGEQDETIVNIFIKKLKRHYLGGYLDLRNIQSLKDEAYMEASIEKQKHQE